MQADQQLNARPGRRIIAALLVGLMLFLAAASASSTLHHWLHADGSASAASCVVCLLSHGQVAAVGALPQIIFVSSVFCVLLLASVPRLTAVDLRLAPGRAPPVFSSPTVG